MPQIKSIHVIPENQAKHLITRWPGWERSLCFYLCGARHGELQGKEQLSEILKVTWKWETSILDTTLGLIIVSATVAVYVDLGY